MGKIQEEIDSNHKFIYYIPVIFMAQIQASHAGEIQHDGKNPYLHTVKYSSKYGMMTYCTSELLSVSFQILLLGNTVKIMKQEASA